MTAAASVTAAVALAAGSGAPDPGIEIATTTVQSNFPTYARGSVIHNGTDTVDVGAPVRAFVRTSVGYVAVDPAGVVRSVVGGSVSEVGRVAAPAIRLVSDPDGDLAGWVEISGDRPAFAVLDQSDGSLTTNDERTLAGQPLLADQKDPAYFYAIDDGVAYWNDSRGRWR